MEKLIQQILKFGVVGVIATLIDYGLLMVLNVFFGVDAVVAAAISYCVSLVFNYLASMRFVFAHRDDMSRKKEFAIFVILSAIGFALNELIMALGVNLLGQAPLMVTITKIFATAMVMIWNFISRKKWLDAGEVATEEAQASPAEPAQPELVEASFAKSTQTEQAE